MDSFGISPWMAIPMALSLTFVPRDLKLWKAFIMSELCWSLVHFLKIHFLSFLLKLALLWKYYGHEQWGNLTLWQQIITIELAWTCTMSNVLKLCVRVVNLLTYYSYVLPSCILWHYKVTADNYTGSLIVDLTNSCNLNLDNTI